MQVRLAFGVAAHLEPEILLVDEVLAVGDAEFQQKCLGRMKDVTSEGRTVVFVSHNLAAVRSLCERALVLERGRLVFDGPTEDAVHEYLSQADGDLPAVVEGIGLARHESKTQLYGDEPFFECRRIAVTAEDGTSTTRFRSDEPITISVDYSVFRTVPALRVLVTLTDESQVTLLRTETVDDPSVQATLEPGEYRSVVVVPAGLFGNVELDLNVSLIAEVNQIVDYRALVHLDVQFAGHGANMRSSAYLRPRLEWQTEAVSAQDFAGRESTIRA
jgi:lipopolysaccharide transport system ATP-binding protein